MAFLKSFGNTTFTNERLISFVIEGNKMSVHSLTRNVGHGSNKQDFTGDTSIIFLTSSSIVTVEKQLKTVGGAVGKGAFGAADVKPSQILDVFKCTSERTSCVKRLLDNGCCARCILRYLGEERAELYKKSTEDILSELLGDLEKPDADLACVCVACLGILQDRYCSEEFCQQIYHLYKKADYEVVEFSVAVSTPVSMLVREHSMWLWLVQLYPDVYKPHIKTQLPSVKEAWRWYNTDRLSQLLNAPFNSGSFLVSLNFVNSLTNGECNFLFDLLPQVFRRRKNSKKDWGVFNRTNVLKALADLDPETIKKSFSCPPRQLSLPCDCDPITFSHEPLFVAGRYNKYSRNLSQTEWIVDGAKKTETCLEELISDPINRHVKAEQLRFSSSGREDVDVLMLGNGRPFLFECINPHRVLFSQNTMNKVQEEINSSTKDIAVNQLQIVTKEETYQLKEGEIDKIKCYSAVCWSEKVVTQEELNKVCDVTDLVLKQSTPIRVLHRRPLAIRDRVIHKMSANLLNDHHFLLEMETQAGTYVKEFVHGDFGRTTPNMCALLDTECDIVQLDVTAVLLDWPKEVSGDQTEQKTAQVSIDCQHKDNDQG